jgi:aminomethyltransferase
VPIIPFVPIGTAFHERTFALCESLSYREWSGYYAVSTYETHHEHEYNAIRNAAALIDISPLFKYRVSGPDATRLVDRVITRDTRQMSVGQVWYTPWCDEHGKVIDDGTVARLDEQTYRWTAADPSLRWFRQNAAGMNVEIEDVSEKIAALACRADVGGACWGTTSSPFDISASRRRIGRVPVVFPPRATTRSGCRRIRRSRCGTR